MIRFLPFAVELVLLVFCVIDIIQTPDHATRNLSKGWWLVLVIVLPLIGCVAWLVAGRPQRQREQPVWGQGRGFPEYARPAPDTSDIDRSLQAELDRVDREYEEALRRTEADLRDREQSLRAREAELERRARELGPDAGTA
jgi:hypothetical protein